MKERKKWKILYTRKGCEDRVAKILTRNNIENYCPKRNIVRYRYDRKKNFLEPLFASYVFVKVLEQDHQWLKDINGVVNLVYWLHKPVVIPDHEIETIKNFLVEYANISLEKVSRNVEKKVCVTTDSFFDFERQLLLVKSRTVKIALPSLGYILCAEEEKTKVEVIGATNNSQYRLSYKALTSN